VPARLLSSIRGFSYSPHAIVGLYPRYVVRVVPDRTGSRLIASVRQSPFAEEISRHGAGMIRGTVTLGGVPGRAKVAALGACAPYTLWAGWSDRVTGRYTIYPLPLGRKYVVMGIDPGLRFDVEAHGQITPAPWEDE
jgi:hypothetical protein